MRDHPAVILLISEEQVSAESRTGLLSLPPSTRCSSFAFCVKSSNGGAGDDLFPCLILRVCVFSFLLQSALTNERDYETLVMMRMRQAAERQRLIEQMQREDEEDAGA